MELEIIKLREFLFKQEKNNFIQGMMLVLENMSEKVNAFTQEEILYYNSNLQNISIFMSKCDYLAIADILKYELLPLFRNGEK